MMINNLKTEQEVTMVHMSNLTYHPKESNRISNSIHKKSLQEGIKVHR